jgi:hypothetical protein
VRALEGELIVSLSAPPLLSLTQNEAMNRGNTLRSFRYPEIAPQLEALGFTMEHAYASLINYLIRPKPSSLAFINQYTSLFALPSVFTIGIQIRTGDLYMASLASGSSRSRSLPSCLYSARPRTTWSTPSNGTRTSSSALSRWR